MRQRRFAAAAVAGLGLVLALAACGNGDPAETAPPAPENGTNNQEPASDASLRVLFGTSGEAETRAMNDIIGQWSEQSGVPVEVVPATDFNQELAQGFAAGTPADIFYLNPEHFRNFAERGFLFAYGDQLDNVDDFLPNLTDIFTHEGRLYAVPKDMGALALAINNTAWEEAGLTDADIPTTWDELLEVAERLTTEDRVGLMLTPEFARVGPFMLQNGAWLVNEDETAATANTPEAVEALTAVQDMLATPYVGLTTDAGAGWGGEAFGRELAAMVVEGPWLMGAMAADHPDLDFRVVEMPAGPAGPGSMFFTNGWGIAAASPNQDAALDLVRFLIEPEQQLAFARAFGPIPSSIAAADEWAAEFPELVAFKDGVAYSRTFPTMTGFADVMSDFNAQLQQFGAINPQAVLDSVQGNLEAIID